MFMVLLGYSNFGTLSQKCYNIGTIKHRDESKELRRKDYGNSNMCSGIHHWPSSPLYKGKLLRRHVWKRTKEREDGLGGIDSGGYS